MVLLPRSMWECLTLFCADEVGLDEEKGNGLPRAAAPPHHVQRDRVIIRIYPSPMRLAAHQDNFYATNNVARVQNTFLHPGAREWRELSHHSVNPLQHPSVYHRKAPVLIVVANPYRDQVQGVLDRKGSAILCKGALRQPSAENALVYCYKRDLVIKSRRDTLEGNPGL